MDGQVLSAILVLTGCHPFDIDKQVVKPARARQTDFIRRVEQRCVRLLQDAFGIFHVQVLQEMLGRSPRPFLKRPLEVVRTHVYVFRHFFQFRLFPPVFLYETDGGGDAVVVQLLSSHSSKRL